MPRTIIEIKAMSENHKKAYIINCSSSFRDAVLQLAQIKKVNVGDIARSIMLTMPNDIINSFPDPGEPTREDREKITLKSGDYEGKVWRRKPRLQARLPAGYQPIMLRKALGLALALATKQKNLHLQDVLEEPYIETISKLQKQNTRFFEAIQKLSFQPINGACTTATEAFYIMGLPREPRPTDEVIKKRFRELANIYHPDGILGDHERMSQLNLAFTFLRRNNNVR